MVYKSIYYIRKWFKLLQSVDKLLERFFRWYGFVLYNHKWIFLIVPIVFTILTSCGFYFMESLHKNETEYVFTPFGSQSAYEKAVINEQFPIAQNYYIPGKFFQVKNWLDVVIKAKDHGNLLRAEHIDALNNFNEMAMHNFTVQSFDRKFNLTYQDLCLSWGGNCYDNTHVELMKQFKLLNKYIPVTYPVTHQGDVPVYLASVYGGVNVIDDVGRFNVVTSVRLSYHLMQEPGLVYFYAIQWKNAFQEFLISYQSPYLEIGVYHGDSINQGLKEIADKFWPEFMTTFAILSTFTVACSFVLMRDNSTSIDWIRSKPIVAVIGITSACMAIATGMGVCFIFQQDYNQVVNTMPFLALSIGVNDMFIMTNGWHRTKLTDSTDKRLSEMMSEAAVAITITSFTDVLSFMIGTWNSLPAVIMFCEYTAVALLFDYIYQITFFSAAIAIYGDLERQGRHCLVFVKVKPTKDSSNPSLIHKYFFNGSSAQTNEEKSTDKKSVDPVATPEPLLNRFFRLYYGPFLMHPVTKCIVVLTFCTYLAVAFYGCYEIKDGLQPDKLVLRTHYVHHYFEMMKDFWTEGMQVHIVVNNPPNITDGEEREKLLNMVTHFENTTHTLSPDATLFFLREYLNYLNGISAKIENTTELWQDQFRVWLDYTGGRSLWLTDIKWGEWSLGEDPNKIKCFRFQVGLKNFPTSKDTVETMDLLRSIANRFPEYNITTFHEYWPYADQYEMIKPTMLRDNISAIITMLAIALVLIPNVLCGIFITSAMITINIGVYGFMSLWGVNLDAVSMIALIMAIGFAIDLSCHICYAYICSKGTPTERTVSALEQLGWPVFQGATATILGVLVLATVDSYLVQTFFKTVFLVILFGLIHSNVFLPVSLALLLPERKLNCLTSVEGKTSSVANVKSSTSVKVDVKV